MKLKSQQVETISGWLFILPSLVGFGLFMLIPILFSFMISFTKWNFLTGVSGIKFIGISHYIEMWSDRWFTDSLKNNLIFAAVTVPAIMLFSLIAALILNKGTFFKGPIRLMVFMPYVSSAVAIAIVWGILYDPSRGPINQFLVSIGIDNPPGWLSDTSWALVSIIILTVWMFIGYNMVIYLAGLQNIPRSLYEAAKIDGAGIFTQLFMITLPLLSPTTFFVLVTCIIQSFQVFIAVFIMTQGGPGTSTTVLTYYIYQAGFNFYRMGYASAMSWVLFIIIFIVTIVQWQKQKKWVNY